MENGSLMKVESIAECLRAFCNTLTCIIENQFLDLFLSGRLRHILLFDLILYVPSTIFQLNRDRSSWVEPVLS